MKKDKKFLKELEENLVGLNDKKKKVILDKYENIIKTEKENKKKITAILKELGNPKDIAEKEMSELKGVSFGEKIKDKINDIKTKLKSNKEKKEKKSKKDKIDKSLEKNRKELKKQIKKEKKKLKKELKEDIKKSKKDKKEKKDKKDKKKFSFKDTFKGFGSFLTKDRKFKKEKSKTQEVIEDVQEVVEDVKEDINEELTEVSNIVSEKKIFESKKDRRRRILLRTLGVLLTILLLFIWLWVTVVFIASIFAYLDGVKFIGLNIALLGLDILVLWIVIMVNRLIFNKKKSWKLNLIIIASAIVVIALGIVLFVHQASKVKTVKDVSVKYSMTNKFDTYNLSSDSSQKFTITFNSNYNTQYTMNYDEKLKNKVKIEVKYYECYYDYYIKQTSNSVYISLKLDNRDRLSVYIDDLKEGLVFDNDELSRYSVKITVNPDDAQRLVIQD